MGKKERKNIKQQRIPKEKHPREKGEIPFYRSIAARMIVSFLMPVVGVVVLGIISYNTASNALVNTYKDSVQQTANTVQQYVNLVVTSEKDEFKNYLTEPSLKKYFAGLMDTDESNKVRKDYHTRLANKLALDSKLKSACIIADNGLTIDCAEASVDRNVYSDYLNTAQGQISSSSSSEWFIFGRDPESDTAIGLHTSDYCMRIAKQMNNQPALMILEISDSFIQSAMQSLDPGEGGYVAMITEDGKEFYSKTEMQQASALIYGTDFYKTAAASSGQTGNQMVRQNSREYLFVYSKLSAGNVMITALIPSEKLLEQSARIQQVTIILIIVCSILALGLGLLLSRQMSGTIHYILRQLRKVSKGDLTIHLTAKKQDEFGLLCDGINDTVSHVKDLIAHVNEVSQQVGEAAAHMAETSGTFMETSQDIQNAVSEIEIGINRLDSGSGNCLNQMDSLSDKINNVSSNAGEIERLTSATGTTINSGIAYVQGLTQSAESTAQITQNVIFSIEELENKSKSISNIISAINDIAEQTNLLSLNASIEAARAGDAGKGFAVVAEEIRKLSDQCLASAGQIGSIVEEIVAQTREVVAIAKQAEDVVSSQSGAVENTTSSFRQIDRQVEELMGALRIISNNVQEMNNARNETLNAIENISAASTETAACSTSVYDTAGTQLAAIRELDTASQQLAVKADRLLDILTTFQV